jgi:hypothetical protein
MNISLINIGSTPNDGTGESIRSAFDKVNDNFNEIKTVIDRYNLQTPANGSSIDIDDNVPTLVLDPGVTLASLTITMPPTPEDGQIQRICTSKEITSLTLNANTNQTLATSTTTLTAGSGIAYIYSNANNYWYRLY